MKKREKKSEVIVDEIVEAVSRNFDFTFTGTSTFIVPRIPKIPEEFSIGLIVGPSGSGKTTLLNDLWGISKMPEWDNTKAICSHFSSVEEAQDKLSACGLNSIPDWVKPHSALSNGGQFRANMARILNSNAVIDEFTSVIDRTVAKSCSYAMSRYIRRKKLKNVVFASCHYDIIEWLNPDWVWDLGSGTFRRGCLQPPKIEVQLLPCTTDIWPLFARHHYLTGEINKTARCWIAVWEGIIVGFTSIISLPSGTVKKAWREHRTVVLPDYQGLGIGTILVEAVGEIVLSMGGRLFSKTAHPRVGAYRDQSPYWRATSSNGKSHESYLKDNRKRKIKINKSCKRHWNRVCFSHEYIGGRGIEKQ